MCALCGGDMICCLAAGSAVFLDKYCLNAGEDWETGFLRALKGSLVISILVSTKSIQGIIDNAASQQDNYLLEIEVALDRTEAGTSLVMPCFIGQYHTIDVDGKSQRFLQKFGSDGHGFDCSRFPDSKHASEKSTTTRTIRETMAALYKLQGMHVDPDVLRPTRDQLFDTVRSAAASGVHVAVAAK